MELRFNLKRGNLENQGTSCHSLAFRIRYVESLQVVVLLEASESFDHLSKNNCWMNEWKGAQLLKSGSYRRGGDVQSLRVWGYNKLCLEEGLECKKKVINSVCVRLKEGLSQGCG